MSTARIIDRVDARAKALGLSDCEIYRRAKLPKGLFTNARKNAAGKLSADTLQALAPVLDVPVGWMLGEDTPPAAPADPKHGRMMLAYLRPSPINERRSYDEAASKDLEDDIADRGILQNLNIYPDLANDGIWLVAAGGRRLRACNRLQDQNRLPPELVQFGLPVRYCADEREALVVTVVENLHREDPHPLDRAAAYARLRDDLGWTSDQIAASVHKGRDHVSQYLRVHDRLPEADKDRLLAGELTFTAAREMVAIPGTRGDRRKEAIGQEEAGLPLAPPTGDLRAHNDEARRIIRRIIAGGLDGDIDDLAFAMDCIADTGHILHLVEACDFLTPELWAHLQWFEEHSDLPDEAEAEAGAAPVHVSEGPFDRASIAQALSVVGKEIPAVGAPVSVRLGQALSAEFPKLQNYDIRPGDRLQEDLGLPPDSSTADGIAAVIVREFGVTLPVLDIRQARSVGEIARMIIRRMGTPQPLLPNSATGWPTPSRPSAQPAKPAQMPDRPPAVGGTIGQYWAVHAVQLTLGGAPLAIELRNIVSGDTMRFVPVQRDIEDDANGRRSSEFPASPSPSEPTGE